MDEEVNYEKLLADVEAQIAQLQSVAAFARMKLGAHGEVPIPLPLANHSEGRELPSDAFFNMSASEAIKKYLNTMKKPQGVQGITNALRDGGFPHQTENLYGTVYSTLKRGHPKLFSKVKKKWGLAEWYNR